MPPHAPSARPVPAGTMSRCATGRDRLAAGHRAARPCGKRRPRKPKCAEACFAEVRRIGKKSAEHGRELAGRTGDHLKDFRCGRLLLERFAQLAEQPRVLDGDHRLRGEVLDQLDLLVGERPNLLPVNDDAADQLVILEHGHDEVAARAGRFDQRLNARVTGEIAFIWRRS